MLNDLYKACLIFRNAIIKTPKTSLSIEFENFPHGSCGSTCLILGLFLENRGFGAFDYVSGMRNGYSHAWLEKDGIVSDITADQFEDCNTDVYVGEKNPFYLSFIEESRHIYSVSLEGTTDVLYEKYSIICKFTESL